MHVQYTLYLGTFTEVSYYILFKNKFGESKRMTNKEFLDMFTPFSEKGVPKMLV